MEFTHLHGHSTYSFLEAIWTPKQLVEKCKFLWFSAIGMTDLFSMYWAIKLYESCNDAWITPIIWTELWFVLNMTWYNKVEDIWNICLLAKNVEWYQNLMKIVSVANEEWIVWKPKIDVNVLEKFHDGVLAFMWWEESWIGKMILRSDSDDKIIELIWMLRDKLWDENVYFEIVAQDEKTNLNLKKVNNKVLDFAKKLGLWVITWNIYNYIEKDDKNAREMALAIKDNKRMFDSDRRKPIWDYYLMTWDEIKSILLENGYLENDVDNWIATNNKIAAWVDIKINMWQWLFPKYQTPDDIKEVYDNIKDSLISD